MDTKSFTCWTDPLHFQFPPTKNLRASRDDVEVKVRADLATAEVAALVASLVAVLDSMVLMVVEEAASLSCNDKRIVSR